MGIKIDCPAGFVWLNVVSTDRSLFKVEAPTADFVRPLSSERPFKLLLHHVRALEIN
jgi:hypothetical protein